WTVMGQDEVTHRTIVEQYVEALRTFEQRRIPVASFISAPGATDFMNTLRISICDYPPRGEPINCDHCRARIYTEGHSPACDVLPNGTDGYLLAQIGKLAPGQRSQTFQSESQVLDKYPADLRIRFFYL